jgi:hypothetical protein
MVGSTLMGFETDEIPTFKIAHENGMEPGSLDDIEIRGLNIEQIKRSFVKPAIVKWTDINQFWGNKEL